MSLTNILRGPLGEFEINRVVGAFGTVAYIVSANTFVAYEVFVLHKPFDLTAYCLSFPAGLATALAAIAGAVSLKDRSVAKARVTNAEAATAEAGSEGAGQ